MATWKKLVVSGSDISQLNNDAGYLTNASSLAAFSTASFNGTQLLADSANGELSFASSSGQGLTIAANAGTDTLTFGLAQIPNASLQFQSLHLGDTSITLGTTSSIVDGLTLTDAIASGSFSGSFFGNGAGLTHISASTINIEPLTDGNGIVDFSYDGSVSGKTVTIDTDGSTLSLSSAGVKVADDGITGTQLNTSVGGVGIVGGGGQALSIDLTEITVGAGLDTPSAAVLNLDLTEVIASDAANRVLTSDGDGTLTAEPNFTFNGTDLLVTGNERITGNLTVEGTASFQNQENLQIADRFILMASGSQTAGDGGIVVQQGTQDVGELFGFDANFNRWAVTSSFDAGQSTFVPDAYMATIVEGAAGVSASAAPTRYTAKGNIFVTDDSDIFMYS
jgi:hypothetical protein|tara:strand:- start:2787 stop:3968 length:1182 start_codon:yes stop_codon:yes gene_type:complete